MHNASRDYSTACCVLNVRCVVVLKVGVSTYHPRVDGVRLSVLKGDHKEDTEVGADRPRIRLISNKQQSLHIPPA